MFERHVSETFHFLNITFLKHLIFRTCYISETCSARHVSETHVSKSHISKKCHIWKGTSFKTFQGLKVIL